MSERRVVLVTGSTDGIGLATARALAAAGLDVLVHGRSKVKVDAAVAQLAAELPGATIDGVAFDFGTLAAVRKGAAAVLEKAPALHALVNNAGIIAAERLVTADGIELTFAVNHVAPFLLTELLLPRLIGSAVDGAPSRVINVASIAHMRGQIHRDVNLEAGWQPYVAYAQSKLANVMHAIELAARHSADQLVAYSLHPGAVGTKLLRQGFGPVQGVSTEQGARTPTRLAASDRVDEPSGTYFSDGTPTPPSTVARDADVRAALWSTSLRLARLAP